MASGRARVEHNGHSEVVVVVADRPRLGQLWQMPLLVVSVGLFAFAAYLFIDVHPGLSIAQKIDIGRAYIKQDRPEAALEYLNKLLGTEKMEPPMEGQVHLLIGEALELGQKQKKIAIPVNFQNIIDQTQVALKQGVKATGVIHRRLGEAFEGLRKPADALGNYRLAAAMDPLLGMRLQKKVIELQLATDEIGAASDSLDAYLKRTEITDSERAWALGAQAQIMIDRADFVPAAALLTEALRLELDPVTRGEINYRIGYSAWKTGDNEEAERCMRLARDLFKAKHPLDGDASYVLGKIYQDKGEPQQAVAFYQVMLTDHPESRLSSGARMGRALCRIMLGDDEAGLSDLHDLTGELSSARAVRSKFKPMGIDTMRRAATMLTGKNNFAGALEAMTYEQELQPDPPAAFFARLGSIYEKRADQLAIGLTEAREVERVKRTQDVRDLRAKAGDAFVAYSRALTLSDDKGYGDAMWKGIDLYDAAGDVQRTVAALEVFVAERPDDRLAPDALLRLGRAYQAAGAFDKAIAALQKNQYRYAQTLAASKSAIPLAQAYIAKGPEYFTKAEKVLRSVVENNPVLTPEAAEFKEALLELGQLYTRTGRFDEALVKLSEWTERYSKDDRMAQATFLMAEGYRKGANQPDARLASASSADGAGSTADAGAEKKKRTEKARELYDRVIELCKNSTSPLRENEKLQQKLSYFYRADCLFDLGQFDEAIKLYDQAALRYRDDPAAVAASIQIVNAYSAMGKKEEAKAANERAKLLLRKMPAEAFSDGSFALPKEHWEQWLKWTGEAGM